MSVDDGGRAIATVGRGCRVRAAAGDRERLCVSSDAVRASPPGRFDATGRAHLLAISAHTEAGRDQLARSYLAFLRGQGRGLQLRDICFSAGPRRAHHRMRLAPIGSCHDDLIDGLRRHLSSIGLGNGMAPVQFRESAQEFQSNCDVDWERIGEEYGRCVGLSAYPWQRSRHGLDDQCIPTRESDVPRFHFGEGFVRCARLRRRVPGGSGGGTGSVESGRGLRRVAGNEPAW